MTTAPQPHFPNPLHHLIFSLHRFIDVNWKVHHAENAAEFKTTSKKRNQLTQPFWKQFRVPSEAIRAFADPALAWCVQKGFVASDHTDAIEIAADLIVALAKTHFCGQPSVYSKKEDAGHAWEKQGLLLQESLNAYDRLRRLAALTGEPWRWNGKLPWDTNPGDSLPEPESSGVSVGVEPQPIDTTPDSPKPPESLIQAALQDVPRTIADMQNSVYLGVRSVPPGQRIVDHHSLVQALIHKHHHGKAAAEWAINQLVAERLLLAAPGQTDSPGAVGRNGQWIMEPATYLLGDLDFALLESTPELWAFWHASDIPKEKSAGPGPAANEPIDDKHGAAIGQEYQEDLRPNASYIFRRSGPGWELQFDRERGSFGDTEGLVRVSRLLACTDKLVGALELMGVGVSQDSGAHLPRRS